jgi:hypothetical protein
MRPSVCDALHEQRTSRPVAEGTSVPDDVRYRDNDHEPWSAGTVRSLRGTPWRSAARYVLAFGVRPERTARLIGSDRAGDQYHPIWTHPAGVIALLGCPENGRKRSTSVRARTLRTQQCVKQRCQAFGARDVRPRLADASKTRTDSLLGVSRGITACGP